MKLGMLLDAMNRFQAS